MVALTTRLQRTGTTLSNGSLTSKLCWVSGARPQPSMHARLPTPCTRPLLPCCCCARAQRTSGRLHMQQVCERAEDECSPKEERRRNALKEKLDPEVLIRAHFHGCDEEGCEDQSGQHTTAWVPMSLLNENEQQEEVRQYVQKFVQQAFNLLEYEFDLQVPTSRLGEAPAG